MKSNFDIDDKEITKTLFFELIDRLARFELHFGEIQEHFYSSDSSNDHIEHEQNDLFKPFYDILKKVLHSAVILSKPIFKDEAFETKNTLNSIQKLIHLLHDLHEKLGILPRPKEPPELKRFGRVLSKHSLSKSPKISIYVNEQTSEATYVLDPLAQFKDEICNPLIEEINHYFPEGIKVKTVNSLENGPNEDDFHITIPRIDASNSCRWPSLAHELAHKTGDSSAFVNETILQDFRESIGTTDYSGCDLLENASLLEKWLIECWCDLFGAMIMGPSFWFSQASAFIFSHNVDEYGSILDSHPPPLFRLLLIQAILRHRFNDAMFTECEQGMSSYRKIIDHFDKQNEDGFLNNHKIRQVFLLFRVFFMDHFLTKTDDELALKDAELNTRLTSFIKYSSTINGKTIVNMVDMLEKGVPISSYREPLNRIFSERPSHVQEVLFAAWLYRISTLKNELLMNYSELGENDSFDEETLWKNFQVHFTKEIKQFNYAVLRSIQVGEWFDLLQSDDILDPDLLNKICPSPTHQSNDEGPVSEPTASQNSSGVLVDHEILTLLCSDEMIISPIINIKNQLGSTSLDLRLGTSFQIYYPNQVGIVDLNDKASLKNANQYSNLVDLDFLGSITIAPGQFVLAHSMEYILLPEYISGELDGRSSFARLGIEIHMTAGFIDPGFQGVLTYEIYNAGPNPIKLYPGLRIGQLRFIKGKVPHASYKRQPSAKYRGLLQHHNSLQSNDYEIGLYSK